ncbi:MAG: hypothetical protein MUD08_06320 [Cytophagales bacterium]|jgi:hypothetical protein|nr:hypothetical protein [Cytophagales bacterium]
MKHRFNKFIIILCMMQVVACRPDPVPPHLDGPALYERFHGKYKVVTSTSSVAVDVNADGIPSTDLLQEISDLGANYHNYLEIRVILNDPTSSTTRFLFKQFWPEQEISVYSNETKRWEGEDMAYQPDLTVNYSMQGRVRWFTFSPDLKSILVEPNDETDTRDAHRWTLPDSVTILDSIGEPQIKVVNRRRFYTSEGVKEVLVTTIYQRFTMIT